MIHTDPTTTPILLFILSLATASVAVTLDSVPLMLALCAMAAVAGGLACLLTARTHAARGIGASALSLLGIAVAVAFTTWRPAGTGAEMFFFTTMFPAFTTAVPMFTACCACVLAAGMEGRKVFLALCAAIAVAVIPRFVFVLFGGLSLFAYAPKNYEFVPDGGGGVSGGGISTDWNTF